MQEPTRPPSRLAQAVGILIGAAVGFALAVAAHIIDPDTGTLGLFLIVAGAVVGGTWLARRFPASRAGQSGSRPWSPRS